MLTRRFILTLAAAAMLASTAQTPADTHALSIAGEYQVDGRNADGQPYTGRATITELGMTVAIHWEVGGDLFSGTGALDGRVLTVKWGGANPVIYVVMPSGNLHGTWDDGQALEKLTLIP